MPIVDENRLKGNWGAAHVAERLSGLCLVRPVSADTDVGLDLYCESLEGCQPFLHFWLQVKAGAQCTVAGDGKTASCSFKVDHLNYWSHQPVPVYAALVPSEPTATQTPHVYVVDVTQHLLLNDIKTGQDSQTLQSQYIWTAGNKDAVSAFLAVQVPVSTALLKRRDGVIAAVPALEDKYFKAMPLGPIDRFTGVIQQQIRRTAAFSILSLPYDSAASGENATFRRRMAGVLAQFDDDDHWETYAARAYSHHVDVQYAQAVGMYERALDVIERDTQARGLEWEYRVAGLQADMGQAAEEQPPRGSA